MRALHYPGDVAADLVNDAGMHRILGPDTAKGYVLVAAATYDLARHRTTAWCRTLPLQDLLHGVKDACGQWWLPAAAQADPG